MGNIDVSFLLPEEKIINQEILNEENRLVDFEGFFQGKSGRVYSSSYYFKLVE